MAALQAVDSEGSGIHVDLRTGGTTFDPYGKRPILKYLFTGPDPFIEFHAGGSPHVKRETFLSIDFEDARGGSAGIFDSADADGDYNPIGTNSNFYHSPYL